VDLCYSALRAGAKTDVLDSKGKTLLRSTVENESFRVAYHLLKWGITDQSDLAHGAFEATLGIEPMVSSPYWRSKFFEELEHQREQLKRKIGEDGQTKTRNSDENVNP
jgi:hypothetical protein